MARCGPQVMARAQIFLQVLLSLLLAARGEISDKKHSLRAKVDSATFTAQIRDAMDEAEHQGFKLQ